MTYRLAVDIGGTFTDLQLLDQDSGELWEEKVPTSRQNLAEGVALGTRRILAKARAQPGEVTFVVHGTTFVTNALHEGTFDRAGLIVTRGYRGLLEYGRVHVRGPFGTWMFYEPPPRVIPLEHVCEVSGRINREGVEVAPLPEVEVKRVAEWYRGEGISSVAVSLMWSFVNPSHEREIRRIFSEIHPGCDVIPSSELFPEIREFERAFTTSLTAAVKPSVGAYLRNIAVLLEEEKSEINARLMCMKSSGGIIGWEAASEHPVELALSGPAGGVLGMAHVCESLGFKKAITLDMGGTSTDISYIESGKPLLSTEAYIADYPIHVPAIDIETIGAGGGSIAWVASGGRARVGPRSAGSEPGPAAYGRGGTQATVTDANLVLGRLPPALLSGEVPLIAERAEAAVREFGSSLGLDMVEAAWTIVELATHNMEMAIREVSTRRGRDPRDCVLVGFGGAGPGHACRLAELLEIPTVLLPTGPGVGSTLGLLVTDIRQDFSRSVLIDMQAPDRWERLAKAYAPLATRAWKTLETEEVGEAERQLVLAGDFRYARQQYTIDVEIPRGGDMWTEPPTESELDEAIEAFHVAHRKLCGFDYRDRSEMACELVNFRVAAVGVLSGPKLRPVANGAADPLPTATKHMRPVCFDLNQGYVDIPVLDRNLLLAGNLLAGPVVIEEFDSTTVIPPGHRARVAHDGTLIVDIHLS